LASEYHDDEDLALLAGLQLQEPDRWARIPAEQKAAVAAWLACRAAAERGDDPLPKAVVESSGAPRSITAREAERGWTLNR